MKRVIVGMSGGVDSAVAAYLLKQEGYEVIGVTLRSWVSSEGEDSRCCEIDDARATAQTLGIEYHVFNCVSAFNDKIIKSFIDDYLHGLTPNPCVVCNREIKWERMLYYADVLQADYVATGHYASVVKLDNGRYTVRKAAHSEKDQAYMLYRLTQEQLARTLMPLGPYSKEEVRKIAEEAGIRVASKPDSQEICFITDGNYADFIKGIIHYTVGQRKGLGIAFGHPVYVKKLCADSNEVVLGTEEEIRCKAIICRDLNFMSIPGPSADEKIPCQVKVRYRHAGQSALLEKVGEDRVRLSFDESVRSAAPGQSAVFYDESGCVIGGGIIEDTVFEK